MLVVGVHVSQAPNDKLEIEPAIETIKALPRDLGKVDALVADTGYFSEKNVKHCHGQEIVPLIASKRESRHPSLLEYFTLHARAEKGTRRVAMGLYGMESQADVRPKGSMRWVMPSTACLKQRKTLVFQ